MDGWIISILTGSVAASITGLINHFLMKNEIESQQTVKYKELITGERIKWIHELRVSIDELIADSTYLMIKASRQDWDKNKFDIVEKNFIKNRHLIILMLSPKDDFAKKVDTFFDKSLEYAGAKMAIANGNPAPFRADMDMNNIINTFSDSAQTLLKNEWEKVKKEAGTIYGIDETEQ